MLVANVGSQVVQAIYKIRNRTLTHAVNAIQTKAASSQTAQRCQKSNTGATVFQPQIGVGCRQVSAATGDDACFCIQVLLNGNAQLLQALQHHLSIFAIQDAR